MRLHWQSDDPAAVAFRLAWWTNSGPTNFAAVGATNAVVTNLARRVTWNFQVAATDTNGSEAWSEVVQWPVPSPVLSNHVVTVTVAVRDADALAGPWRTNATVIYQATNAAAESHFWESVGLSISQTNF